MTVSAAATPTPAAPPKRIPATIVTGFLGAGKTSLIRHVVERAGRRIALIVNEFGEIGVDGGLLRGCGLPDCDGDDIVELANGCICCTVAEDFLPTVEKLLDRPAPPEHIIIETSGLALPEPLVRAFSWPEVRARATIDGVIAVIDGPALAAGRFAADPEAVDRQRAADPALDHRNGLAELFEDQTTCADLAILNKTDLLDNAGLAQAEAELRRRLRPGTGLIKAGRAQVDPRLVLGLEAAAEDGAAGRAGHHESGHDHDHHHDDFESLQIPLPDIADPAALAARVAAAARDHGLLRVKGFAHVPGKPMRLVLQAVGERVEHYFGHPWSEGEERNGALVVIGLAGLDPAALGRALAAG